MSLSLSVFQWYTSRLGPGSGSTPTITTCQGREVVVITDGELDMGLIYYDIDTGDEIARTKVRPHAHVTPHGASSSHVQQAVCIIAGWLLAVRLVCVGSGGLRCVGGSHHVGAVGGRPGLPGIRRQQLHRGETDRAGGCHPSTHPPTGRQAR